MIKNIEKSNENVAINDKEIAVLREHFPACFKNDGSFDIERFKETLKDKVDVVHEGYELKFLGKSYAKLLASLDTTTVITPNEEHNNQPENANSENIYISGDNLDGLKHLLKSYAKSVKCIYIDPPYNTGSDGFVYKDNFNFTAEELQDKLSVDENQANRILELTQKGSASHSAWLMFMYSRLQLAKDLLKDDGVIFISIDDNEQANLKLLCDDVFGEENFLGNIVIQTATDNNKTQVNKEHEYILTYCRNKSFQSYWVGENEPAKLIQTKYDELKQKLGSNISEIQKELRLWIKKNEKKLPKVTHYDNVDEYGVYHDGDIANTKFGGYTYDIVHPITKKICKVPEKGFRYPQETLNKMISEGNVLFGENENILIKPKKRLENSKDALRSIIYEDGRTSTNIVESLLGRNVFNNPKSHFILKRLIGFVTNENDIIIDFFSGSASTAHSVLDINAKKNEKRKFISIQIPVNLNKDVKSEIQAFNFLSENNLPTTLDYIGFERIKRAAKKIKEETNADIDYGFKHFILNEPNPNTLDKCETFDKVNLIGDGSILEDFGVDTVLTTWLNYDGYGLTTKATELDLKGYKAYYHQKHLYLIHTDFTQEAVMDLFEKYDTIPHFNPENIVLFGYSFNEWSVTEMLEMNLKILNDTEKNLKINIEVRY